MNLIDTTGTYYLEVDPTHSAVRTKNRPVEILGAGQYIYQTGTLGSITAPATAFSFANLTGSPGNTILVRNVGITLASNNQTATGVVDFAMYINRSLTANDSGGTVVKAAGILQGRKRSNLVGGPTLVDCRGMGTSTALTAGTYTADSVPFRTMNGYCNDTGSFNQWNLGYLPSPYNVFSCQNSGYPLVLAPGEGFNIKFLTTTNALLDLTLTFVTDVVEVATPWS